MTKSIRIENACTSHFKVEVEVWQKAFYKTDSDILLRTILLGHPTAMTPADLYIHSGVYLIVKEVL